MAKFKLPAKDVEYLNSLGVKWDSGSEDYESYVIIYDVGIDTNYYRIDGASDKVNILFMLPSGYPNTQIDMSSFYPDLSRTDGQNIPNLHRFYNVKGFEWQTWSRHRTGGEYWNPETDGIASHLAYTDLFLQREVGLEQSASGGSHFVSTFVKKTGTGFKILRFPEPEKPKTGRLIINMGK